MAADGTIRITAPRQLRLSALLAALREDACRRRDEQAAAKADAERAAREAEAQARRALPAAAATIAPGDPVVIDSADGLTIGEMLDATAAAGFGFVVALLGLTAIPFVGLSTPFGAAIAFIGAQMLIGRVRPWLPERVRRVRLSVPAIDRIGRWLSKATHWMTHLVRARLARLCNGGGLSLAGLGLFVQGLGLALPLPIPGSNLIFLIPILVYAIGLLEDDGLLVLIAHVATLVHLTLAVVAWQLIAAAIGRLF